MQVFMMNGGGGDPGADMYAQKVNMSHFNLFFTIFISNTGLFATALNRVFRRYENIAYEPFLK